MDTADFNTLPPLPMASPDLIAVEPEWSSLTASESVNPPELASTMILPPLSLTQGRRIELGAKRVIDLVGASFGLALLTPLMMAIALLIRLDSPGPILFKQRRLGRKGVPFWIYKFRTMRADAEQRVPELESRNESARGVLFKIADDPRVTRLGRFLRRANLDELPQLWNVIRGEMSLVGPRPFQIRDSERLKALDPASFAHRLEFPPGLTGAWQVGRKDPTDSEHLIELDLEYIHSWSLGLDLWLIYKTFFVLIDGFRSQPEADGGGPAAVEGKSPSVAPARIEAAVIARDA